MTTERRFLRGICLQRWDCIRWRDLIFMNLEHHCIKILSSTLEKKSFKSKLDTIITAKEYSNRAEIITTALRFWLDNRDKTPKDQIIEWLRSDDGEQYIEIIMKRIVAKKK